MKPMTSRERILRMMNHQEADRIPFWDDPWASTVERWEREGMPIGADYSDYLGLDKVRKIGIDNSPEAIRVILQRFSHGLEPMGDFVNKPNSVDVELELFAEGSDEKAVVNGNGHHKPIREFELWKASVPHA